MIKVLILVNNLILISKIEEVPSELGEPDCKLISPFIVETNLNSDVYLKNWNSDYTLQDTFMIHSDKILTIVDPKPTILQKYEELLK